LSYLGAKPLTSEYYYDTFTGDGSTVGFVTTIAPASPVSVLVIINGNVVDPESYFFEENNIYFLTAPVNNSIIQLRYLALPSSGVAAPYTYRGINEFIATEGQSTFKVRFYDLGYIDVYVNGSQLGNDDYQASDGITVILQTAARKGDLVRIVSAYNTVLTRSTLNATPNTVIIGNGLDSHREIYAGSSGNLLTSNGINWISSNVISGSISITNNLSVSGNLTVTGNLTSISANNLVIDDTIIYLANNNSANVNDIGFVGHFTDSKYQHTGLIRDASDGTWKLFSNVSPEPTGTIDFNTAVYDTLKVGTIVSNVTITNGVNLGPHTQAAFDKANTGVSDASSASSYANTGINNAASASLYANTGINNAASASLYANTGINNAASASLYANTGINNAASASLYANTGITNAASASANAASASLYANTGINNAASASLYANTAINNAASASLYANTGINNAASASSYANVAINNAASASACANTVPQKATSNNYTLIIGDTGKHLYYETAANNFLYIPDNGRVGWAVGTRIMIVSKMTTGNVIVTPNANVSLYLAGNSTPISRNVNAFGVATLLNTGANTWFMTGFGVGN
jgi:hypothetical protein